MKNKKWLLKHPSITWNSKLGRMCCDRIHIPYNVAGITSLGDDNAIVLPKMFSPLYSSGPHFLSQFCNENRCYQKCSQKSQKRSIGKKRILSKT